MHLQGTQSNSLVCVYLKKNLSETLLLLSTHHDGGPLFRLLLLWSAHLCLFLTRRLPQRSRGRLQPVCVGRTGPCRTAFESTVPPLSCQRLE